MARKSWQQKMEGSASNEVKPAPADFADIKTGQLMLLTSAKDVADYIANIPKGQEIDIKALRSGLAKQAGAETACPIVTGICLRIVAECTGEKLDAGLPAKDLPPVWRAMPPKATIWKKLENGADKLRKLRVSEGLEI